MCSAIFVLTNINAMDTHAQQTTGLNKNIIEKHEEICALADNVETDYERIQYDIHESTRRLRNIIQLQQMAEQHRRSLIKRCIFCGLLFLASLYKLNHAIQKEKDAYFKKKQKLDPLEKSEYKENISRGVPHEA